MKKIKWEHIQSLLTQVWVKIHCQIAKKEKKAEMKHGMNFEKSLKTKKIMNVVY